MDNLIVIKQLPVIEERLRTLKVDIEDKAQKALSLAVTEDTVKQVKEVRATLNKEFSEFEKQRKEVKTKIMTPYEEFEKIYKECVSDVYKSTDKLLAEKISDVENRLKEDKKQQVEEYFNEYLQSKNIDFITFDMARINVTLSASLKSLKDQAKVFIDKIESDLLLINEQEHKEEILVEYKSSFDVSSAIRSVNDRHRRIEEEKAKQTQIAEIKEQEQKHVEQVQEVLSAPVVEEIQPVEQEQILTVAFKVRATKSKIFALKQFLINGGYDYE